VTLIEQGLLISLLGLLLTFLALGMLILTIIVLQRLFSPAPVTSPTEGPGSPGPRGEEDELAAAIAAAVLLLRAKDRHSAALGGTLENGPGRWWQRGQTVLSSTPQEGSNGRDR
jgi:Na+-transporting methylmalonyl-CoA/oxaloacetate decarboxylase gamma subunit